MNRKKTHNPPKVKKQKTKQKKTNTKNTQQPKKKTNQRKRQAVVHKASMKIKPNWSVSCTNQASALLTARKTSKQCEGLPGWGSLIPSLGEIWGNKCRCEGHNQSMLGASQHHSHTLHTLGTPGSPQHATKIRGHCSHCRRAQAGWKLPSDKCVRMSCLV